MVRVKVDGFVPAGCQTSHPKVSHWGEGSSDSRWSQCSRVSPSQGWLGSGLGASVDLVSSKVSFEGFRWNWGHHPQGFI